MYYECITPRIKRKQLIMEFHWYACGTTCPIWKKMLLKIYNVCFFSLIHIRKAVYCRRIISNWNDFKIYYLNSIRRPHFKTQNHYILWTMHVKDASSIWNRIIGFLLHWICLEILAIDCYKNEVFDRGVCPWNVYFQWISMKI